MKEGHYSLTDQQYIDQFEALVFNPRWFNHEAHIRLAWAYLNLFSLAESEERMCKSIQQFDAKFDEGIKYHRTITIISLRIIKSRLKSQSYDSFKLFIEANQDLIMNLKDVISAYYSWNVFIDTQAKIAFLPPDLKPPKRD